MRQGAISDRAVPGHMAAPAPASPGWGSGCTARGHRQHSAGFGQAGPPEGSKDAAHRFCWAFCVVTDSAPPVFLWVQRGRCPSPQPSLPLRGPAPSLARGRPRQAGLGHRGAATPLRCWQTVITITAGQ